MATELKVSFSKDMQNVCEILAQQDGVTTQEYIREVIRQHLRQKQSKIRYKALRYAEPAAIIMDYISSDYDIDSMMFNNLTNQQVRNKIVSAANEIFEFSNSKNRVAGLREVQEFICDLSRGARSVIDEVKRQTI